MDVDELFRSGRWQLSLIVAGYLFIVYVTNRVLITSPVARGLLREVREEETYVAVLQDRRKISETAAAAVHQLLDDARRTLAFQWGQDRDRPWRIRPMVTLAKVLTARRYLHGAQEARVELVEEQHLAIARIAIPRLREVDWPFSRALADLLEEVVTKMKRQPVAAEESTELPVLVKEALKLWFAHDDAELDIAQDAQRRSMWLVCVGLALAFVLGLAGHRLTLLFGALGGFLSPLTLVRQRAIRSNDYATSWGPILLSPVAGALTAYAGLLLLELLSDDKIGLLGDTFRDNAWSHPTTPLALGFAILLGFSARLFSGLALAAVGAVSPQPSAAPAPDHPDDDTQHVPTKKAASP